MNRKCYKCKQEKSLDDFPRNKGKRFNRSNLCKECNCERLVLWRKSKAGKNHKEDYRERFNKLHKKYRKSEKGRITQRAKSKRMREKYPEKWSARAKLRYAVRVGKIVKPKFCENYNFSDACTDVIHAHHDDYSKPLDVKWLCDDCHRKVHN